MRRALKISCALTAGAALYALALRWNAALFERHRAMLRRLFAALGRMCAQFKFSGAEIAGIALLACAITMLASALVKSIARRSPAPIAGFAARFLCIALPAAGAFNLIWPVHMDTAARTAYERAYSIDDLQQLIRALDTRLRADETGINFEGGRMKLRMDFDLTAQKVAAAYEAAGWGTIAPPKAARYPEWLSRIHAVGIFIPFTGEAIISPDELDSALPFTMLHEAAHSLGAFREDEANMIALKVGLKSDDAELRWSSALTAMRYALNTLRSLDEDLFDTALDSISPAARRELDAMGTFTLPAGTANAYIAQFSGNAAAVSAQSRSYFARTESVGAYDGVVYLLLSEGDAALDMILPPQ